MRTAWNAPYTSSARRQKSACGTVCALVKGNVETPGDISGVVYIPMDENGAWKMQLCKNMQAAGLTVDANKMI